MSLACSSSFAKIPSIIRRLVAGEKGMRSSVRRHDSPRLTDGYWQRVFVLDQRPRHEVSVASHEISPAHENMTSQ